MNVRLIHTDHLAPLHDLSEGGRSALANLLGSWFVSHSEIDRAKFGELVDEASAVSA